MSQVQRLHTLYQSDHLEEEFSIPSSAVGQDFNQRLRELLLSLLEKFHIIIIVLLLFNLQRSKIVLGPY